MKPPHVWITAVTTAAAAAVVVAVRPVRSVWSNWRPATCMPDACFCEAIRDQLVRQPVNALSGLAFVAAGMLILLSRPRSGPHEPAPHNPMRSQPVYAVLFAVASIVVGIGTVLYHASLTFVGQTVDVLGMYLVVTFIVVYNIGRLTPLSTRAAASLYTAGNTVLLTGLVVLPQGRRFAFAALVLLAIGLEIVARRKYPDDIRSNRFAAAVLVLMAGFVVWVLDLTRALCAPHSWLQGHALWHLAGATAVWLIYDYYRSAGSRRTKGG